MLLLMFNFVYSCRQEAKARERRIESQLKGLSGQAREDALRVVLEREQQKKGYVSGVIR